MAAKKENKCRKIEKKDTTQQARTALLASEEKEEKEGKIRAVARDGPTSKYANTKLSAHCEDKSKKESVTDSGKKSKAPEYLDKDEGEEVELSIRQHTEADGSSGAQHPSAYVGVREFADKEEEEEETVALAYLNQRGGRKEGREREWGGGSLSGWGVAGESHERKKKKEKHDGANVTNETQLGGGGGGVTLFQAALERVHSRDALETIRKLVCNCAEHPGFLCYPSRVVWVLSLLALLVQKYKY